MRNLKSFMTIALLGSVSANSFIIASQEIDKETELAQRLKSLNWELCELPEHIKKSKKINAPKARLPILEERTPSCDLPSTLSLNTERALELPIRAIFLNTVNDVPEESRKLYTIDGKTFRRQNVSGTSMRCFFNAVGLEADIEIVKLKSKLDDLIVCNMIANEIISAAANPEQLPQQVKEAIGYTLYEAQRAQINRLEESRSNALRAQSLDGNLQNTQLLPTALQSIDQEGDYIPEELGQRALSFEAFNAFLDHHILSEQMMVVLHDVQGDEAGDIHANHTSIDAVAYINNLGLKIYQPNGEGGLRLVHQYIPNNAEEVAYLYHEGIHFQALKPISSFNAQSVAFLNNIGTEEMLSHNIDEKGKEKLQKNKQEEKEGAATDYIRISLLSSDSLDTPISEQKAGELISSPEEKKEEIQNVNLLNQPEDPLQALKHDRVLPNPLKNRCEINTGDENHYEYGKKDRQFKWHDPQMYQANIDNDHRAVYRRKQALSLIQFARSWLNDEPDDMKKKKAIIFYRIAATYDPKNIEAQLGLARCYLELSTQKDFTMAVNHYLTAADLGNPHALECLGYCYEWGKGVPKDLKKALQYYKFSQTIGSQESIERCNAKLALCYDKGLEVSEGLQNALPQSKNASVISTSNIPQEIENRIIVNHSKSKSWGVVKIKCNSCCDCLILTGGGFGLYLIIAWIIQLL